MSQPPEVDGVSHRWVDARGIRFHYAEAGSGDDVVLCLHGWPQHWYEWRHLMPALADRYRVIALDLRGYGWSDAPPSGYEKENMADDVLAVLDELGIERVKLVGHDWGAWIGFLLALRAPQRFERYLALNILPPWVSMRAMAPHLWRFWYQWLILSPGIGSWLHTGGKFMPKVLVGASVQREVWDEATLRTFSDKLHRAGAGATRRSRPTGSSTCARPATSPAAATPRPASRSRPSSLFGKGDLALKYTLLEGYEQHADEMRLDLVADCGHFIADEMPELVAEKAREFFA